MLLIGINLIHLSNAYKPSIVIPITKVIPHNFYSFGFCSLIAANKFFLYWKARFLCCVIGDLPVIDGTVKLK